MAIGGILCRPEVAANIRDKVLECKGNYPDGMKWERIRFANVARYMRLMDYTLDLMDRQVIDFSAVILNTHQFDHMEHNEGDAYLGFNKFIAYHLFRHAREMRYGARIHSYLAAFSTKHDPATIRSVCNSWCMNRFAPGIPFVPRVVPRRPAPYFAEVKHRPFKAEPVFSVADILLGAVAKSWNGQVEPGSPKHKVAEQIRLSMMLPTLAAATPPTCRKFDVWEFELSGPQT